MAHSETGGGDFQFLNLELAFHRVGDAAVLRQMLEMLSHKLASDVPQIGQFLAARELQKANRLLHPLKGVIPIFCEETLCNEVTAVEVLSKTGPIEEVAVAYDRLRPKLECLQQEVERHLS